MMDSPVESVATVMCLFLAWIGKNSKLVSRLEKESKKILLMVAASGVATLVGMMLEQESKAQQQRLFIEAAVTEVVYTEEFWDNNSRHKKKRKADGELISKLIKSNLQLVCEDLKLLTRTFRESALTQTQARVKIKSSL